MSTDWDTVHSYDAAAAEYAAEAAVMSQWVATEIGAFVSELDGSGRILEIGSGGGRDASEFENKESAFAAPTFREGSSISFAKEALKPTSSTRSQTTWPIRSAQMPCTMACGPARP